ncbi:MAG TPA: polyphenol oxidase family protein [Spirochaetota bacterium]|nr:polyphenol oxidase family protein [Spirochaetota bacterium]
MRMMKFIQAERGIGEFEDLDDVRVGVVPKTINRIDYGENPEGIRFKEKLLIEGVTGIAEKDTVMLNQVHGDDIIVADRYPDENLPWAADADGIITNLPELCLVIRTADCVPVFAVDEERRILGAVHSGWKGCRANITGKLVRMMREKYGCDTAALSAFILPSIGPDSYRVNEDVAQFFPDDISCRDDGIYLSLWKNVESALRAEGVRAANIFNAERCTLLDPHYFSHRRGDAGRNLNFAYLCDTRTG